MDLAQSVIAFTLMALVVTLTPGLDMVLVLRQSLRGRRSVAFAAAMGVCVGALLWGDVAPAGLAALFVASQSAYNVLRFAGVAYLLWLAWGYLRAAWRGDGLGEIAEVAVEDVGWGAAFAKGLLTDLLNPKMAVFYLTLLPLFLPVGYNPVLLGTLLAGIHALMAMAWFTVVILSSQALKRFLTHGRGARVVDGVAGTAMLAFGIGLTLEHH